MARKMNPSELALATRSNAEVTNRHALSQLAALYLMQVRAPQLKISPPRKRLYVAMDAETREQIPQSVKIIHAG